MIISGTTYSDNTVMYAIAPNVDQALLELQLDFFALRKALVGLKHALNVDEDQIYMLFCNFHETISDGLHIY